MLHKFIKYSVSLIVLLHCLGLTQLVSSYSKDRSAFVSMANMNEEETKKETESKEDVDDAKNMHHKHAYLLTPLSFTNKLVYFSCSKSRVNHQFFLENPTPPPDTRA